MLAWAMRGMLCAGVQHASLGTNSLVAYLFSC